LTNPIDVTRIHGRIASHFIEQGERGIVCVASFGMFEKPISTRFESMGDFKDCLYVQKRRDSADQIDEQHKLRKFPPASEFRN
jgi:hypothetical protein